MLKNYMTQNFTVVETQTEKKGSYVPIQQNVADVRAILDGAFDGVPPEDLLYIGTLKEVEQKIPSKSVTKPGDTAQPSSQNTSQQGANPATNDQIKPPDSQTVAENSTPEAKNDEKSTNETESKAPEEIDQTNKKDEPHGNPKPETPAPN
jgi:hypothetical protein